MKRNIRTLKWAIVQTIHRINWKLGLDLRETRCYKCKEKAECPGYNMGVVWPCDEYEKERRQLHG